MAAKPAIAHQEAKHEVEARDKLTSRPLADISNTTQQADDDDWTPEELMRLQAAVLRGTHPTKPRFWQHVAKHVGRRPSECAQKMYSGLSHKSLKALPKTCQALTRKVQLQQQQGLRMSTSKRTGPRATEASTRRKMRADSMWTQLQNLQLTEAASTEAPSDCNEVAEAVEKLQKERRAHQYTSSILHRRGGWIKYQRGVTGGCEGKLDPCQAAADGDVLRQPKQQPQAAVLAAGFEDTDGAETAESITAALEQLHAERLRQQVDSEEESDEYFNQSDEEA